MGDTTTLGRDEALERLGLDAARAPTDDELRALGRRLRKKKGSSAAALREALDALRDLERADPRLPDFDRIVYALAAGRARDAEIARMQDGPRPWLAVATLALQGRDAEGVAAIEALRGRLALSPEPDAAEYRRPAPTVGAPEIDALLAILARAWESGAARTAVALTALATELPVDRTPAQSERLAMFRELEALPPALTAAFGVALAHTDATESDAALDGALAASELTPGDMRLTDRTPLLARRFGEVVQKAIDRRVSLASKPRVDGNPARTTLFGGGSLLIVLIVIRVMLALIRALFHS